MDAALMQLWETLTNGASIDFWWDSQTLKKAIAFRPNPAEWGELLSHAKKQGIPTYQWQAAVDASGHANGKGNGVSHRSLAPPESLTQLLAADIPAPKQLFEGLMHEGMLLFGGKSKRGKSWLMFDLAIAGAVGRAAFRHFECAEAFPVLY